MRLFRSKGSSRKDSIESLKSQESTQNERRGRLRRGSAPVVAKTVPPPAARPSLPTIPSQEIPTRNKLSKKPRNFPVVSARVYERDQQTGEQKVDHTDLLHSLINDDENSSTKKDTQIPQHEQEPAISGTAFQEQLPARIWDQILDKVSLVDKVSLSFSCRAFYDHLKHYQSIINLPEYKTDRTEYLLRLDQSLPNHLLCFSCFTYHRRISPGNEILRPTNIANPIYICPQVSNIEKRVPKIRLTSGRALPFAFAQLLHRHTNYGPLHGLPMDALSRRYRDNTNVQNTTWTHQTRFSIVNGHLLLRVTSTTFATPGLPPAGLRNLLYNPAEEFHPYFSTCPHWRDGELMPLVKCALSHIPKPLEGSGIKRVGDELHHRMTYRSPLVTLCGECRPMRRCPECPTEYLIEIKMTEDKKESDPTKTFKQALVVTRWSDLGDGSTPENAEWAACSSGLHEQAYDSMSMIGRRAIAGVFESQFTVDVIPGQRILNLNPKGEKKGEAGHKWY